MTRELIFSVTIQDCEVQTFSSGGPGGQNQNRRSTGVRIVHTASGARGECREQRSQMQNKKVAFRRMAESAQFQNWLKLKLGREDHLKAEVERMMWPNNIKTDVRVNGKWVEES